MGRSDRHTAALAVSRRAAACARACWRTIAHRIFAGPATWARRSVSVPQPVGLPEPCGAGEPGCHMLRKRLPSRALRVTYRTRIHPAPFGRQACRAASALRLAGMVCQCFRQPRHPPCKRLNGRACTAPDAAQAHVTSDVKPLVKRSRVWYTCHVMGSLTGCVRKVHARQG